MKGLLVGLSIFFGVVFITVGGSLLYGLQVYNTSVEMETTIEAQYKDNQNIYDNYVKTLKETAHVTDKYAADFKEVVMGAISGRYGEDGSKAVFQWIKENNPTVDASMYKEIQRVIASGRKDFENSQRMLLDKIRVYKTSLRKFPFNIVSGMFGFPTQVCNESGNCKAFFDEYDIVTSESTEKTFETKKADALTDF